MRTWILVVLTALTTLAAAPGGIAGDLPGSGPQGPDALVVSSPVEEGSDLVSVSVEDATTGAVFRVLFDAASEAAARRSIPVLAGFYRNIADLVAVDPATVPWADVLFARDADDLLIDRKEGRVIWRIGTVGGKLDEAALRRLYVTIPHEQVHATQGDLPRWYAEGQAEWAGLRVTRRSMPEMEQTERATLAEALAATKAPLSLAAWGGVRPKIEAILRQLTPEQRTQFLEDPGSVPLRAMSFGPDDLVSDESNSMARYAGALALFEQIEGKAGRAALQGWFKAVRRLDGPTDSARIAQLANEFTDEDISRALE